MYGRRAYDDGQMRASRRPAVPACSAALAAHRRRPDRRDRRRPDSATRPAADEVLVRYADDVTAGAAPGESARDLDLEVVLHQCRRPDAGRRRPRRVAGDRPSRARRPTRGSSRSRRTTSASSPTRSPTRTVLRRAVGPPQHGQTPESARGRRPASPTSTSTVSRRCASRTATRRSSSRSSTTASTSAIPDLAGRAWTNPGEIRRQRRSTTTATASSTTSTAGTSATTTRRCTTPARTATGRTSRARSPRRSNGTGVVGVAPASRSWPSSSSMTAARAAPTSMAIDAIDYAASLRRPDHQRLVGRSRRRAPVLDAAIADSDALFVAAAGNDGLDLNIDSRAYELLPGRVDRREHR